MRKKMFPEKGKVTNAMRDAFRKKIAKELAIWEEQNPKIKLNVDSSYDY